MSGARRERGERRLRTAAVGVGLVGMGLVAVMLWAASSARAASPAPRAGSQFSAYIDDLPIMPGLTEDDEGYAFDLSQGGRLAEARLGGEADPAVVRGFYAATLSQLGWKPSAADPHVYHRGRERLIFLVEPSRPRRGRPGRGLEAVFVVTPASEAAPASP